MFERKKNKRRATGENHTFQSAQLSKLRACLPELYTVESLEKRVMLSVSGPALLAGSFVKGAVANYQITATGFTNYYNVTEKVIGAATASGGQSATELDTTLSTSDGKVTLPSQFYNGVTSAGVVTFNSTETNPQNGTITDKSEYSPPSVALPLTLTAGVAIDAADTDTSISLDSNGIPSPPTTTLETFRFTLVSDTTQSITVPAGTFDTYEVDTITSRQQEGATDQNGDPIPPTVTMGRTWYALNLGPIKSQSTSPGSTQVTTEVLISYSLGGDTLSFTAAPKNVVAGQTLAPVTIELLNADGTPDTSSTAAVTLTLAGGHGTLSGTTTVNAVNGAATFQGLSINKAGDYTIVASSSAAVQTLTSQKFKVTGDHVVFTTEPTDAESNAPIQMVVTVEDQNNGVDTSASGTIDLTLNKIQGGVGAVLGGTISVAIVNGVAKFTAAAGPNINVAGVYTLTATQMDIDPSSHQSFAVDTTTDDTSTQFTVSNSLVWSGAGDGVNWSDPKNWVQDAAPVNGVSLIFPAGKPLNPTNDKVGLKIATIDIQGGGYNITGNAISLTGGITSEAGNNTYNLNTTLIGSPTLDDEAGDLTIASVLSGDGLTITGAGADTFDQSDTYTGTTTLSSGVTIHDDAANGAFGTGPLSIGAGSSPVTIDAQEGEPVTLDNPVIFQDGSTLAVDPQVILGGTVTINGQDSLKPLNSGDQLTLDKSAILDGFGTLTITGGGKVLVQAAVPEDIRIVVLSGEVDLDGALQGSLGMTSQVTVKGGSVQLLSNLSGMGGIDVENGTLISSSNASGYGGTITLESSNPLTTTVMLTPNANVLGTGELDVLAVPTTNGLNYPKITTGQSQQRVTLVNPLRLESGAGLTVAGLVSFTGIATLVGSSDFYTTATSDKVELNGDVQGTGKLTLGGPGAFTFFGKLAAAVSLNATNKASGLVASLMRLSLGGELMGAAGGTQVVADAAVQFLAGVSGSGGIDLQGGTLNSGGTSGYSGAITIETNFFQLGLSNVPDIVLTSAASPLGTGPLLAAGPGTFGPTNSQLFLGPTIDASAVAAGVKLGNALTFQNGGQLQIVGSVTFDDAVTVSGADDVIVAHGTDSIVTIKNGVQGSGTLVVQGGGTVNLAGTIPDGTGMQLLGPATLNLSAKLLGALSGPSQVAAFLGTLQLMPGLTGTGSIEIGTTLRTGGTIPYTGDITLDAKANLVLTPDTNALGTGQLIVATDSGNHPMIDATEAPQGVTLNNALTLKEGADLHSKGVVTFADVVTLVSDHAILDPLSDGDQIVLNNGIDGTGTLYITGAGTTTIKGDVAGSVALFVAGQPNGFTPGVLELGGFLLGPAGESSQVDVVGGTLRLLTSLEGTGGIDLKAGTLESGGATGYSGTITLEQQVASLFGSSVFDAPGANVVLTSNTSALGSGPLVIASPTTGPFNNTVNSPTIDATAVPQGATLSNAVTIQGGALLNFKGSVIFSNVQNVNGFATVNTTQDGDQLVLNGTVQGNGSLVVDGDGTTTVTGTLTAGVGLIAAATLSGTLNVGTNLQGGVAQVTVSGGTLGLLSSTSGSGGIHVVGGTLVTDATTGAGGSAGYKGTIALENGGTIHDYDATDANGLGIGTLNLRGGLLQNTANGIAILSNPVTVTGTATVSSRGQRFKLNGGVDIGAGDSLDVFGTLVLNGPLTGSGSMTLDGDELDVAGSNPTFTGAIIVNSGVIAVTKNDALGTGPLIVNLKAKGLLESVDTISDPILNNAVTINGGTLRLQGLLTFPKGVTINSGTTLDIEGTSSQIVVSGPLAGGGSIVIGSGNFTMPGGSTSFTGAFSLKADINRDGIVDTKDLKLLNASMGTAGAQPQDGDANGDGSVNFADLVAVAQHYGQHNVTLAKGDFNGDGTVDFTDLVAIAQHYGHSGRADLNDDGIVNFADFQILELAFGLTLPVRASVPAPAPIDPASAAEPALPAQVVSPPQPAARVTATMTAALPSPAKASVVRKDASGTASGLPLSVRRPVLKSVKGTSNGSSTSTVFSMVPITPIVQSARRRILDELLK